MRRTTVAMLAFACLVTGAPTQASVEPPIRAKYDRLHDRATKEFGYKTVGRDIVRYGMPKRGATYRGVRNARAPGVREVKVSIARMERWLSPPTAALTPPGPSEEVATGVTTSSGGSGGGPGAGTVQCESGGDPTAVDPSGTYRGKYQFDQGTWERFGGTGDPAAAPESVQDQVASRVTYDAWPNC